jgi:hypothetical protein
MPHRWSKLTSQTSGYERQNHHRATKEGAAAHKARAAGDPAQASAQPHVPRDPTECRDIMAQGGKGGHTGNHTREKEVITNKTLMQEGRADRSYATSALAGRTSTTKN